MSRLDLGRKRKSCHSCRWLLPPRKPPSPRPCPRDTSRGSGNLRDPREGTRAASGTVSPPGAETPTRPPGPDEARVHVTPWRPGRGLEQRTRVTSARVPPGQAEARGPQNAPFLSPEPPPPPLPLGTPGTPDDPHLEREGRWQQGHVAVPSGLGAEAEPRGCGSRGAPGSSPAACLSPPRSPAYPARPHSRDPAPSSRDSPSPVGHRAAKAVSAWTQLLSTHTKVSCAPPWHRTRTPDPAASCGPCPRELGPASEHASVDTFPIREVFWALSPLIATPPWSPGCRLEEAMRGRREAGPGPRGVLQSSGPFGANLHEGCHRLRFTGSFIGLCCRNPRTTKKCALSNMMYFQFPLSKDSSPTFTTFNM
ncbi:collagen alpha-1(I) chain-like [Lagenorhynchus albirostris]|uniref:collagen alpha-1(I) chain-like n=1 Tax=Lagenorhynchus albirostris TaxID=27610 RepID=UPI0028EDD37E|nr:collagen alpha-1(I) chain-like [Lagenorhynchus albirostris]